MIHDKLLSSVKVFSALNDRICYILIVGKVFDVIIINFYAPTKEKSEDIKKIFYEELESVYDTLPLHCAQMIISDMNAKVGKERIYRPVIGPDNLQEVSNENGTKLIHFVYSRIL